MDNIVIRIRNRYAMLMTQSFIVNGNTSYIVEFDFDSEWDEYAEKTARFVYCDERGARHWIDVPITDNTCNVPRLERIDKVEVGVYAGNIRTSTPALIPCLWSILCYRGEKHIPVRNCFRELLALVNIYETQGSSAYKVALKAFEDYWNTVIKG
ncbi:MAG: hypothetical protein IJ060_12520 [Oscillospiraceae bacterium]|nr:hypothetical protein [Oscillospiraceae bacterium]MBQ8922954.1 hypothetical protein [Oscillospiraceae bacterium]